MNRTENVVTVGKRIEFALNNDKPCDLTDKAYASFIEWCSIAENNKKWTDNFALYGSDWKVDIKKVIAIYHIATGYDNLSGGEVDVLYFTFKNEKLNRFVYLSHQYVADKCIVLPIDGEPTQIPFDLKIVRQKKTSETITKTTDTAKKTVSKPSTNTKKQPKKTAEKVVK